MQPEQKPSEPASTAPQTTGKPAPSLLSGETPIGLLPPPQHKRRKLYIAGVILALAVIAVITFILTRPAQHEPQQSTATSSKTIAATPAAETQQATNVKGVQLDTSKKYGDKYANGIMPVGDNQYSTTAAEKGKVYMCRANFVPASQAGAQTRGPWFIGTTQWDINKKSKIQGSVHWEQKITNTVNGNQRTITTNDLPDHITGTFPVSASDPASAYDRNPNTISTQSLTYTLAAAPEYGDPQCIGGEVGIMLTGVALFNGFDAGGRDAGAWEVQDDCDGHPQGDGEYHYHTLSRCIKDVDVKTVIGYALDGFPITGPKVSDGNYLTTNDLDECHGLTSQITLDGKKTTSYHYVMTQDFPYSASCFRAKAIDPPHSANASTGSTKAQQPAGPPQQPSTPPAR